MWATWPTRVLGMKLVSSAKPFYTFNSWSLALESPDTGFEVGCRFPETLCRVTKMSASLLRFPLLLMHTLVWWRRIFQTPQVILEVFLWCCKHGVTLDSWCCTSLDILVSLAVKINVVHLVLLLLNLWQLKIIIIFCFCVFLLQSAMWLKPHNLSSLRLTTFT